MVLWQWGFIDNIPIIPYVKKTETVKIDTGYRFQTLVIVIICAMIICWPGFILFCILIFLVDFDEITFILINPFTANDFFFCLQLNLYYNYTAGPIKMRL